MAQVNFRIDDQMKSDAEELFSGLGLNMSTAITIFIKQSLNRRGLPFEVRDFSYQPVVNDERAMVNDKLREASRFARKHRKRLTHEQVFSGLQELIDAGRSVHA